MSLLEARDLHVSFSTEDGVVQAVRGVSLEVDASETVGIVGESGCGKSVTALTLLGLTRLPNATVSGTVVLDGIDVLALPPAELHEIRGRRIAVIFQDPLSSLHPFYRVGWQIVEAIKAHEHVSSRAGRARAIEALREVGIPSPAARVDAYPHELSGGMRQRVMIAMALVLDPDVLIADEPTTALDVTVQAQILELIERLQEEHGTAVILITHDLGVVAQVADRVLVMYAGRVVEQASLETLLTAPEHPYTWGLLQSIPRLDTPRRRRLQPIPGAPPSLIALPGGCPFRLRCPHAFAPCPEQDPPLLASAQGHAVACHLAPEQRSAMGRALTRQWAATTEGAAA
jgi:peptide/nickel transport system ATP-binding protein